MKKLDSIFKHTIIPFLLIVTLLMLISCMATPIKSETIVINNKHSIPIPANAQVAIYMKTSQLEKKYVIGGAWQRWELDEGKIIQGAALDVLSKIFTDVLPYEDCNNPQLVAKIDGLTKIQNTGAYTADANLTLSFGNGDFIKRYSVNGTSYSAVLYDSVALENAYINAFKKIASMILQEEKLSGYFQKGFPETVASKSGKSTKSLKETATSSRVSSIYEPFLNSVVVINSTEGMGTGFFANPKGYIITNAHVVGYDSTVSVRLRDGRVLMGRVNRKIGEKDLALIEVSGTSFPWLVLGNLSDAPSGLEVIAIGAPKGLDWSISKGIISASRNIDSCTLVQTDTPINHGNSGGPLISLKNGKVIGVNTLSFNKSIYEGLNFAVSGQDVIESFPEIQSAK